MSELENVSFKITLSSKWWSKIPNYEILLDDKFIEYGVCEEQEYDGREKVIEFSEDLDEGDHYIKIRLLGKTDADTMIDESGNILKDMLLNIKQIEIDEIELDFLFYQLGEFYRQSGTKDGAPVFKDEAESEKYVNIGYNGEYRLKFSVPTYMWFLENL